MDDFLLPAPSPEVVRAARLAAGHTQAKAAELMGYGSGLRISKIELGSEGCDPRSWTLYLLAIGQHPAYKLHRATSSRPPTEPRPEAPE